MRPTTYTPRPGMVTARQVLGLTQGQLGERVGIRQSRISEYEHGRLAPSLDTAIQIARALDSTVEEVFARTPDAKAGRSIPEETSPQGTKEPTE